jgi:hypothetical protein
MREEEDCDDATVLVVATSSALAVVRTKSSWALVANVRHFRSSATAKQAEGTAADTAGAEETELACLAGATALKSSVSYRASASGSVSVELSDDSSPVSTAVELSDSDSAVSMATESFSAGSCITGGVHDDTPVNSLM